MEENAENSNVNTESSSDTGDENKKSSNNKMTLGMVLVVIIVIAVIGGYFLFSNRSVSAPTVVDQNTQTENTTVTPEQNMESTGSGAMQEMVQDKNVKNITVEGTEFSYTPSTINVSVGDSVHLVFTNKGTVPHNLDIPDLSVKTKTINPGETDSVDFTASKVGTYSFYCTVDSHKDKGMVGTLVVK